MVLARSFSRSWVAGFRDGYVTAFFTIKQGLSEETYDRFYEEMCKYLEEEK